MKTFKYFVYTLAAVIAFASCAKEQENEYKATPAPKGDEVQFAQISDHAAFDKTTNVISLTDNEDGFFEVFLTREKADKMALVEVESEADEIFTVASSAIFEKGEKTAAIKIEFDPEDIVAQKSYDFTLTISGEPVSKYAVSQISFQAGDVLPLEWHAWKKGTMTEAFWGETEQEQMYYAVLNSDAASLALFKSFAGEKDPITAFLKAWEPGENSVLDLYCYIENCFDTMGDADPTDYYFTWHLADNSISIAPQYMGWTNSAGNPVYFSDATHFYMAYYGWDFDRALQVMKNNNIALPFYDGNGGFYLADWYITNFQTGNGYQFGGAYDVFIADGFVRTVDYNPSAEVYAYKDFMEGSVESIGLGVEWDDQPLMINEYAASSADKALYYLPDYFDDDLGLAFTGPLQGNLKDGAPIQGVANEQPTGMEYGGKPLFAVVTGGKITIDAAGNYVFTIKVQYETMAPSEDDPEKLVVYGTLPEVEEVFTSNYVAEYYSDYQLEPVKGKRDFYGTYRATAFSLLYGPYETTLEVAEGGWNEDRTEQYVAISGLFGDPDFNDTVYAEYEDGFLVIPSSGINVFGDQLSVIGGAYYLNVVAPLASADFETESDMIGGIYTDPDTKEQKLVFVGDGSFVDGLYFYYLAYPSQSSTKFINYVWNIFADYTNHEVITEEVEEAKPTVRSIRKSGSFVPFDGNELRSLGKKSNKTAIARSFALSFTERSDRSMEPKSVNLL